MTVDVGVKPSVAKEYLGDGLYVAFDGYQYCLSAENGTDTPTNVVYMDPSTLAAFGRYVGKVQGR